MAGNTLAVNTLAGNTLAGNNLSFEKKYFGGKFFIVLLFICFCACDIFLKLQSFIFDIIFIILTFFSQFFVTNFENTSPDHKRDLIKTFITQCRPLKLLSVQLTLTSFSNYNFNLVQGTVNRAGQQL